MAQSQILLLEDIAFDIETIRTALDSGGIESNMICVDNRQDFIAALQATSIDLVLADYALPNFDGLAALDIIRGQYPHIPFILVSGLMGEELAIETLKQGATDYVLKQRLGRLVPAVKRALNETAERRARYRAEQALQESEDRFRASVEIMLDCFGIYSAIRNTSRQIQDFRIEYLNTAACQQLGQDPWTVIGQRLSEQFPMYQAMGLVDAYAQVVETGQPLVQESLLYEDDQAEVLATALDVRAAKLGDSVVVTWRNITDRKLSEQERESLLAREQAAREEAEAASRVKDEFLATLSHELRTPLNAMQGWLQLLQRRRLDEGTATRALATIQRNVEALRRLIEDVLDVSRIIRGKLKLTVTPLDVAPVVLAATETILPAAEAKQIDLQTQLAATATLVLGDRNRLQQIIWNLLSNAIKFTPEGGRVDIRLEVLNHYVQIQVQDSGKGIEPEFLPHIFERFRQADSSTTRRHMGLGLGLAIVRHLVELHGGLVRADSPGLGQGATFTMLLPQLSQTSSDTWAEGNMASQAMASLKNCRILIVDDQADARELYTTFFKGLRANVKAVATATEALTLQDSFRPDVLVSDVCRPGMQGYELIQQIRQRYLIPAIALMQAAVPEEKRQVLAAGFQIYLSKPVEMQQLADAIAHLTYSDATTPGNQPSS
ncbi:hypothetical protein XM38_010540 [Halomicronema hongdechloris C2206]|uniref:Circadian input-output histidine kinase CikA n=1 Tax=Halomicronema hongdechloris C2206 TaxID=1641165 RepID=A0A1Z3HIH9_9CYAN|nr:response regulator [Halomicronema hongdechloris]ASC70124.1 hypothetical protein XM38_010540 [Halomicronema hongdechloris C2206]